MVNRMKKTATKTSSRTKRAAAPKNKTRSKIKKPQKTPATKTVQREEQDEKPTLLNANQARKSLETLNGWQTNQDHKMIYREYRLKDFDAAVQFINRIAKIADAQQHHPDVHLTQFRNLRVAITTHEVGGLSKNDFAVAEKINELPVESKS